MASSGGGSADVQIRLTLIRDGRTEVVTVRLPATAYQACTHFNEEFLRLLFSNNIPEWIASAYQTRTLYLFSELPVPKGGDPKNLQKQKNYEEGVWWNTTDKEDITTLKQHLHKPLYLAKVCRHCTQKDSETLFVLKTKDYFDRGYCHIKACQQAANAAAAAAAATAPSWSKRSFYYFSSPFFLLLSSISICATPANESFQSCTQPCLTHTGFVRK